MSEWRAFRAELRSPKSDVAVLPATFALTVLVDLTVAIEVGMVLAAFLFIKRMAEVTNISAVTRERNDEMGEEEADENAVSRRSVPKGVEVVHRSRKDGTVVLLSDVHMQPLVALTGSATLEEIGRENLFGNLDDALNRARSLVGVAAEEAPGGSTPTVERERIRDKKNSSE